MKRFCLFLSVFATVACAEVVTDPAKSVDAAHAALLKFVSAEGLLQDYLGDIPTAAECAECRPNAKGWWTPIENGPMFTGPWLAAVCARAQASGRSEDRALARRLADGLLAAARCSDVPGFIARGMGAEPKIHYPVGSMDQTLPWFYGLWCYYRSGVAETAHAEQVKARMLEVARALEMNGWKCPNEPPFDHEDCGDFLNDGLPFRNAAHGLFLFRILAQLEPERMAFYREKSAEKPKDSDLTRLEICARGYATDLKKLPWLEPHLLWIYVTAQGCLKELSLLEPDEPAYRAGLRANATRAAKSLNLYEKYDNSTEKPFRYGNWRTGYAWRPQQTLAESDQVSRTGKKEILGTRKSFERDYMTAPLSAAAICAFAGTERATLEKMLVRFDWETFNVSEFFLAEVAWFANRSAFVKMAPGERWWGGANFYSRQMPFDEKTDLTIDLRKDNYHNQGASLLLSSRGRVIWSDAQASIAIRGGTITLAADGAVEVEQGGATLRDAYLHAMRRHFPPTGRIPPAEFFTAPQLNTWIELTYHQNQKDVLAYAKSMLAHGVPAGVLMIDDTWQAGYGDWRFEPSRFPDPKGMMDELHGMGYKVMLWMCPYVGMDLPAFRRIAWGTNPDDVRGYPTKGGFLSERGSSAPKACSWWNGYSAFLDFSHPNANAWFTETLDGLVRDFGVDGFKLDGADLSAYDLSNRAASDPKATNGSLETGYVSYALRYPYSEIRNTVGMQQQPVVVRLHDKKHAWESLPRIVADMMGAGILGYPFICPDMVGGGEWTSFIPGAAFDSELFLRSAQIHALCPMMQISASPWRILTADEQKVFEKTVALRQKFAPQILRLAEDAARDGEPILRSLEYNHPNAGYAAIRDEFMMGRDLLVAPVLEKGAKTRKVVLPPGRWRADDGTITVGPAAIEVATPLDRLPHFVRVPDSEA